jgi:hypothetical protein
LVFTNIKSADNLRATFFAYNQVMKNSLIVGRSKNIGSSPNGWPISGSQYLRWSPCGIEGVHFAGFSGIDKAFLRTNGAAEKSTVHWARDLSFDVSIPSANKVRLFSSNFHGVYVVIRASRRGWNTDRYIRISRHSKDHLQIKGINIESMTKSSTLRRGATLRPEWSAWINVGAHFGLLRLQPHWPDNSAEIVQVTRCGQSAGCQTVSDVGTYEWYYQNPVIVRQDYTYQFSFPKLPRASVSR